MTRIIKSRFVSTIIVVLLVVATMVSSVSVLAVDDFSLVERETLIEAVTRGPNVPTEKGTLPYSASFYNVRSGIYSGKYFTGTTEFTVEIWGTNPSNARFNIFIYEVVDGGAWAVDVKTDVRFAEFQGLSANKNYAIFIKPVNGVGATSGNIEIYGKVL